MLNIKADALYSLKMCLHSHNMCSETESLINKQKKMGKWNRKNIEMNEKRQQTHTYACEMYRLLFFLRYAFMNVNKKRPEKTR